MKQTRRWLIMAIALLCSMTRISAEVVLYDLTKTESQNDEGTSQYEYTSEVISCSESFKTVELTFSQSGWGPWVALAEFYLYDGEGNEIALTTENFSTNAQEPTEGPIENICDGDRTTFFHTMYSESISEPHKLMVTLPEGKELTEFKFKYITRWTDQGYPLSIRVTTDNGDVIVPSGRCGEDVTYTLSYDGHLDISGSGEMYDDYQFRSKGLITSVTIQEGVTSIGEDAFFDCYSLTSITIPEGVTSIGANAFSLCSSLTSITIPEGVTSIGANAFYDCSSLTSITIPESVTSIGYMAFSSCSSLTSITILGNIIEIEMGAFNQTPWYDNQPDGVIYIGNMLYEYKGEMPENTNIIVREGTTNINSSAFWYCNGLTSITIPESVTSIGIDAFYGCSSLASITIPESVTSIGGSAFRDCSSLASITIPESVTSIGSYAFEDCSSLEQVVLHCANVGGCFRWNEAIKEVVLGEGVTTIDESAFEGCTGIERVTMNCPIVDSWFSGNTTIKEIVLGDNVVETKLNAFKDCTNLTSVTLGSGLSKMGNDSFQNCSALTSITCYAETPPRGRGVSSRYMFKSVDSTIPVYVPAASVSSYQSDAMWKYFTNFVGMETGIDNQEIMGQGAEDTTIYDLRGNRVENPAQGIYIINGKKVVIK